jgi:CheY-like chemotaxis protein
MASILIVDDDRDHRLALVTMLSRAGHEAVEAVDGTKALEAIGESTFDVVVTDLQMPGMHGLELITLLRDLSPPPQIIAVSGTGQDQLAVAQALGAKATLNKPVFPDQLLGAVDEALTGEHTTPVLVVSDPPHWDLDLDAAAAVTGLDVFQARLKFNFPGPEVLAASNQYRTGQIAKSFEDAGVKLVAIDGMELAGIPWPNPVSTFNFADTGLVATARDQEVELPYGSSGVAVYCSPPSDFRKNRPKAESSAEDSEGFALVEAMEWMANLDLYVVQSQVLHRISIVEDLTDFAGLGALQRRTAAENLEATVAECVRRFPHMHFDTRLRNVRPRRRFGSGAPGDNLHVRKRYSFGTPQLQEILGSISPAVGDLTQYELGSRLGYITSREHVRAS